MVYTEKKITNSHFQRTFSNQINDSELEWHRDRLDRNVTIVTGNGWRFQEDNKLPIDLVDGLKIFIPKETYHRIHKGNGDLIIEIEEFK